jgi:hypothetical protein
MIDSSRSSFSILGWRLIASRSADLVEAHNHESNMYGFPRLRRLIAVHDSEEGSLVEFLMDELRSFTGEGFKSRRMTHPPYATSFSCEPLTVRERLFVWALG